MAEEYFVGNFLVPTPADALFIPRTYSGDGDPNLKDASYFVPPQRPGDFYVQLDANPQVTWIYTENGVWIISWDRYDTIPPDNTDCNKLSDLI